MDRSTYRAARRMVVTTKLGEICEALYGLRMVATEEATVPEEMVAELDALLEPEITFEPDDEPDA